MIDNVFFILTLLSALSCGLMAGIFFVFSSTVMSALARLQPPQGIAAMQAINSTILNPLFFIAFFRTAVTSILLVVSVLWWWQPSAVYLLSGSLLYLVGVFLVTIVFNVSMNETLKNVESGIVEATNLWAGYLTDWTRWNHVRTIAYLLGALSYALAL